MKKTPLRRKGKKASQTAALDRLCKEVVFLRDKATCQRCGTTSGKLDWAHVHTRRIKALRWDLNNSLALCAKDHFWWHQFPLEGARWFMEYFPARADALRDRSAWAVKPNIEEIRAGLMEIRNQFTDADTTKRWIASRKGK